MECSTQAENKSKLVKLVPPVLNPQTISSKVVCTRMMREGRFNISRETFSFGKETKQVIHCYGHGGAGWSTLFGSVASATGIFKKQKDCDQSLPVRVIGSGCMGLACAIELTRLGVKVSGITTRNLYDIPSWRAAGYLALVSINTSSEEQENVDQIGSLTFQTYQQIEKGKHPYIGSDAVRYLPVYGNTEVETGVEGLEAKGLIPLRESVTLDFGGGVKHENYYKYMTYFMNTTVLMKQMSAEVKKLKIPIEIKEIGSFAEVKEEVIFNCSGIGVQKLVKDALLIPVRGHVVHLNEGAGLKHMDYMIYTTLKQNEADEYVYMFPKAVSVTSQDVEGSVCRSLLGGTFIPNVDQLRPKEQDRLDEREFQKMLDRHSLFFHGVPFPSKLV